MLPSQRLVLETLPKSQLPDHLPEGLFQYCTNAADSCELSRTAIDSLHKVCSSELVPHGLTVSEPARDGTRNNATENAAWLSSDDAGTNNETLLNYTTYSNGYVHTPSPTVLWAGDCEFALNPGAIEAKNSWMINFRTEERQLPSASQLDNQYLLSPLALSPRHAY